MTVHHTFNIDLATELGCVNLAILVHHFEYWITYNERSKKNFYEGKYWMYQTLDQIARHFPYWSIDQVKRMIKKLLDKKILIKSNFNKTAFDRTVWYAFTKEFKESRTAKRQIDLAESPNGDGGIATPIPNTKTNTKKEINTPHSPPAGGRAAKAATRVVSPPLEKHGIGKNVLLTKEQYQHLEESIGETQLKELIEELSDYMLSTGKTYKDFAATLRNWHRRRQKMQAPKTDRSVGTSNEVDRRNPHLTPEQQAQYEGDIC